MTPDVSSQAATPATWVECLRQRAATQGDQVGYRFLVEGDAEEVACTYAQLDRQARGVAMLLRSLGAAGQRALLLHPPGLEFIAAFFGCHYAGVAAVPLSPPRSSRHARAIHRLRAVATNVQPIVALTTARAHKATAALLRETLGAAAIPCLPTNDLAADLGDAWQCPPISSDTTACIQFTSGATGDPRGVVLTHANLLHNSELIRVALRHTAQSRGVIWLPPYHDLGLVGGILQPLYAGFPVTLMSPTAFLQQPLRWLRAIDRHRGTISGGPNFAYELCVQRIGAAERATLDLSSWQIAFSGAEPIHPETLDRFEEAFALCGFARKMFYPCYGLAEATVMVSGVEKESVPVLKSIRRGQLERGKVVDGEPGSADTKTFVGCGRVRGEQAVAIVDPQTGRRCADDEVGEVWVRGPSVAQGYWDNPAATQHTFAAHIKDTHEVPYMRTGDLGFMAEGELFITGRLKDLIIIRGVHYYPQDLELTAQQSHAALVASGGAAFAVDAGDSEAVVIVHEIRREERSADAAPIIEAIRKQVSEAHELPLHAVALLRPGQLPKTPSGKVQRRACRDAFLAGTLDIVALWRQHTVPADGGQAPLVQHTGPSPSPVDAAVLTLEAWLTCKFAAKLKIPSGDLDPDEPFARYGLDSLGAVEVALQIAQELRQELPPSLFWDYPNIRSLARYLVEDRGVKQPPADAGGAIPPTVNPE